MREAKVLQIVEGTNQIQRVVISRSLSSGGPADTGARRVERPGPRGPRLEAKLARVEAINRKILSLLAGDGRLSFTELARQTGLSVSAVQQRVRRLEERGVIRGYRPGSIRSRRACR